MNAMGIGSESHFSELAEAGASRELETGWAGTGRSDLYQGGWGPQDASENAAAETGCAGQGGLCSRDGVQRAGGRCTGHKPPSSPLRPM